MTRTSALVPRVALAMRRELVGEQVRMPAGDAEAPHAERGIRLVAEPDERRRLVCTDVQRADRDLPAGEGVEDLTVGRGLLRDRRWLGAVEEGELGPEDPDALGAGLDRVGDIRHRADRRRRA